MDINDIIKPENLVYAKPRLLNDNHMHYCPGCSHGVVHKLIAEVIEEMGMEDKTVGIAPVGCAVFAYNYVDIDWIEAAHGRAPAVATGVKRLNPENLVFTYQDITGMAVMGRNKLNFHCDGIYQVKGKKRFNALKYMNIFYRYKNIQEADNGTFLGI